MAAVCIAAISMGCAIAVSMAVAPPAARAGFLYVPQDETAPRDNEASASEAAGAANEPARSRTLERPGGAGAGLRHVRVGEMLRDVLIRWGGHAGVEVLFLTDRRYRIHEARAFPGSFAEAAQALLSALSHMPHPPVGKMRADGRTYAVMHRASLQRPGSARGGQ